jgi:hypothetical protein
VKKILKRFSGENDKYMAMFLSGTLTETFSSFVEIN